MKNLWLILLVGIIFCACENEPTIGQKDDDSVIDDYNPRGEVVLTSEEAGIIEKQNASAFKMLGFFNANSESDNFMISPLSAQYALGMLANGASGTTLQEIKNVLDINSVDEFNALSRRLLCELPGVDKKSVIHNANSMWFNKGFTPLSSFSSAIGENYLAQTASLDLTTTAAVRTINEWCASVTDGFIKNVVKGPYSPQTAVIMANAMYLKAQWQYPFEEKKTYTGNFKNSDGSESEVAMMKRSNICRYLSASDYSLAALPLGNGAFEMTVVLPSADSTLDAALASLDAQGWKDWKSSVTKKECDIRLPKYEISTEELLTSYLRSLGLNSAFDIDKADFSALSDKSLRIDDVLQSARVSVDERGCEAAAVTVNIMSGANLGNKIEKADFHVDRPFVFVIEECSTGAIMFMGRVNKL